ncbi:EpsG family protein [Larsenimonas rhizosphaerae]|uniref:EpsG family protein n=1 Tax=Larsenimonas rhizosphaerae TaxID=2944682 RepID=UPI0020338A26|nr:EpsG family protein [Larsenimonas rhizosphaerae]MCM2130466.1 EpsG family protein [Larsenimonas rhizosphaerae]
MTFELAGYLLICALTIFATLSTRNVLSILLIYLSVIGYMIAVRFAGYDYDMYLYARMLDAGLDFSADNVYYVREFVFWFGLPKIFDLVQDQKWTFIVVDIIWVSLLFYALLNKKNSSRIPLFCAPFMIVFFPLLMGYQNIYRQFLASIFVLFAFYGFRNKYVVYLLSMVAFFIHNSAIIYLPLLYLYAARKASPTGKLNILQKGMFALSYVVMVGGIYYSSLSDTDLSKSSDSTGISLGPAYAALFAAFFIASIFMARFKVKELFSQYAYIVYSFFSFLLIWPVLGGAQGERVGMMLLIIIVPMFVTQLDGIFRQPTLRITVRLLFVLLGIAPSFLFSSAFNFLLTGS